MKSTFFYILIFFYFSGNVSANPYKLIRLHEGEGKYPIGIKAEILQLPDLPGGNPLPFEQVSSPAFDSLFNPNPGSFIIFKDGQSHHWVRFKVKNKSDDPERKWLLESDQWYAAIEMYVVYQDGRVIRKKAGTTEQEVDDTHVVLKPDVPAQQEATVFLNLTGGKHFLTIWEETAYFKHDPL